ncbi:MAG: hypothetical protein RL721_178 [Candidatus Eisenbacteria bacterium]
MIRARSSFVPLALAGALLALLSVPALAASRITGRVTDAESQRPIANAEVELRNAGGGPGFFRARTDAQGEFAIEAVPAERWWQFTVAADGYTDWALESWQFPAAQREVRLAVPLDRAGRLVVTALGRDGRPLEGARVGVRRERGNQWWETYRRDPEPRFTDREGRATFEGLAAGPWSASVDAPGLRPDEVRALPVRRGETTPASITLVRPASLAGVVRLDDSTAVAGATIVVRGPSEGVTTTDADGAFVLEDLAPGRYRVELAQDGFETGTARDGVVLEEGRAVGGIALVARPRARQLAFVLERDVFVPQPTDDGGSVARVSLGVRAFRIAALDLVLHRVPLARLTDGRVPGADVADTAGLERVAAWTHELPAGSPFAWRETLMPLPMELAPGAYVLTARGGGLARRQLFFVSDLSVLVKRSGTRLAAWVGSLRTGTPLPGVRFVLRAGSVANGADTDALRRAVAGAGASGVLSGPDGLAWLPVSSSDDVTVVAISERAGVAMVRSPLAGRAAVSGDQSFLFTDRPLVRPGQTVNWKLFARRGGAKGYTVPDATSVTLRLDGPGQSLSVPATKLSASGTASGSIAIPPDAPLGEWTLYAEAGNSGGSAPFAVLQYRKPEFRVTVAPEREVAVNGDDVRFRVAADYLFGAPVVGATVRWTLFESRLERAVEWSAWDPWGEANGRDGEPTGYGRMLQSGETRTDLDGRVSLAFTPARVAYDRRLSLEVEVLDGAQRVVSARGSALMGRGRFRVQVRPVSRLVMAGEPVVAEVTVSDLLGRPVQAAVTVDLEQEVWNPVERRATRGSRPLASARATTDAARGIARVTLAPGTARSGHMTLRARAEDERGTRLMGEAGLWVHDPRAWSHAYRYPSFEAVPDRDAWSPGDTARILVNTDVRDANVLVSVEGRELHELRVQPITGQTGLVLVPIRVGMGPNLFVKLHLRRGREVQTRTLELPVRTPRHDLAIRVTPDRESYRPGERAVLNVETRDANGRAVPAELALGVVDEAIYQLRADRTPRAHDVFYGRIANAVTTVAAFPVYYYGGADKGDQPDVRRDFRDVALWAPDVRTGADGRARVELTWPDNLTTWRATARGATTDTRVGETTAEARVTKDLVARLSVPRTLVAGDEVELVSVVTNRTDDALPNVRQSLAVSGAAMLRGAGSGSDGIAARGEARRRWSVAVPEASATATSAGRASFTLRAEGGRDADALELAVPVRPRTVALRASGAGTAGTGSGVTTVTLPRDVVRVGSTVRVQAATSVGALLDGAAAWLGDYPYGCSEQTANALLGALARLEARAARPDESERRRLAAHVQRLATLRGMQPGWGWWSGGEPDPYLSALAVEALARAARAGLEPELALGTIEGANYGLLRQSSELRSDDGQAYWAMRVATLFEESANAERFGDLRRALDGVLASVASQEPRLSPGGRAAAALAYARLGLTDEARRMLASAWSATTAADGGRGLAAGTDGDAWIGDAVERTAWLLEASLRATPDDARAVEALGWLAARRDGREWGSTRVTGSVVSALARWLVVRPETTASAAVEVRWDGVVLAPDADGGWTVPVDRLAPGRHALEFRGAAGTAVWWSWFAVSQVPSPGPRTASALTVTREYRRAVRTTDRRGRTRWLTSPIAADAPLRVGEGVLVRLTLTTATEQRWLALRDPVPAGLEVDQVLPEGVDRPWNVSAESRDGEAVFFLDAVGPGTTVIEYLVRPELAGRFVALPTETFGMYDRTIAARGAQQSVVVVAP